MRHLVNALYPVAVKRREKEKRIADSNAALHNALQGESFDDLLHHVRAGITSSHDRNKLTALVAVAMEPGRRGRERAASRSAEELRARAATAVSKAASKGEDGIVRGLATLLAWQGGADVDNLDSGQAPLHTASSHGCIEAV